MPLAMQGWQQLMDKWSGCYVEFHELTLATIRAMGGLRRLGNTTEDDMPFVRAQFLKSFEALRNREIADRRQLPSVQNYKQIQAGQAMQRLTDRLRLTDGDEKRPDGDL